MIVMILLMFLPISALPVFWLLPPGQAIAFYVVCLLLSGFMFLLMRGAMNRPVITGMQSMIGREAEVISRSDSDRITPYRVRIDGEIWSARSSDPLSEGETVVITEVRGNTFVIKHK